MANPINVRNLVIIARDLGFQDRVKYCMTNAGLAVMAEAANTVSHAQRIAYAYSILSGTANVYEVTLGVVNNLTIVSKADITNTTDSSFSIPDSDIQYTVNTNFNAFAGVSN